MRYIMLAALILASGCGGDPSQEERLVGTWLSPVSNGCMLGVAFNGDRTYFGATMCDLAAGGTGTEGEWGTYAISGKQLTTSAKSITCATIGSPINTVAFTVDGDRLSIASSKGIVIYTRFYDMPSASVGGSARYGCFMDDKFYPGTMHPVP